MGGKIWGVISILVGVFGLFRSYELFHQGAVGWTPWLLILAGGLLILMGTLRIRRRAVDPSAELLK
jgi:hypothetical protein